MGLGCVTLNRSYREQKSVILPLPFYLFERCAQAIKNKETWTGYLSLGFVFFCFFSIVVCLFCHVCFSVSFVSCLLSVFMFFLSLHVYFFVQIIHIFSCKYSHFAINYLGIKHNEHITCFTFCSFKHCVSICFWVVLFGKLHFTVTQFKLKWKMSINFNVSSDESRYKQFSRVDDITMCWESVK